MELRTLASGSSGNCTLVCGGGTAILIDAGISCRKITQRLRHADVEPYALSGIFITHEHSDHICGLPTLLKQNPALKVYTSAGTGYALCRKIPGLVTHLYTVFDLQPVSVGNLTLLPFRTSHDSAESMGVRVSDGTSSMALATDLGWVNETVLSAITGVDTAIVEANHDVNWLMTGPYPYYLKQRILGDRGHLSNEAGAELAVHLAQNGTKQIILAHLSKENNTPEQAYGVVSSALIQADLSPALCVAPRDDCSEPYIF